MHYTWSLILVTWELFTRVCFAEGQGPNIHILYEFPNGTWVENIAVRSNNQILVTILVPGPQLYSIDPSQPGTPPELIYEFPNATALFGIAEYEPDVFAVIASTFSLSGFTPYSGAVWKVDFASAQGSTPLISKLSDIGSINLANGMCNLPNDPGHLLIADIVAGCVYRFDVNTGDAVIAVPPSNELVADGVPNVFGPAGVDGIHVAGDQLYVANAGKSIFGRQQVNFDGTPVAGSTPTILYPAADGASNDDFALASNGNAYVVTSGGNSIVEVFADGSHRLIAGNINSTEIAVPTSAALSRAPRSNFLYVTTTGGLGVPVNGYEIIGGQVLAIDLSG
ncbi:hypothetical protein F5884DRAFT_683030 [Xylogone sp. PMI_703]|nr:hypothetical protein F5884DRAFT_683030 [Xylogone sp. PMI_703]